MARASCAAQATARCAVSEARSIAARPTSRTKARATSPIRSSAARGAPAATRFEPPPGPEGKPHRAQDTHGIVGECAGRAEPDAPRGEVGQAAGGIGRRGASPGREGPERHGQRVDGEVPRAEIRLDGRRAEVREVDLHRPRQPADAARLVEDDVGCSQAVGEPTPPPERARGHCQVQLGRRLALEDVPHRPAHQPGGGIVAVFHGQEPDDLAQRPGKPVEGELTVRRGPAHRALTTQRPGQPATVSSARAAPDRASADTASSASAAGTPRSRATRRGVVYRAPSK